MSDIIVHPTVINGSAETLGTKRTWRTRARDFREELRTKARRAAYGAEEFARRHPRAAAAAEGAVLTTAYTVGIVTACAILDAVGFVDYNGDGA